MIPPPAHWYGDPITVATVVIAVATVVSLFVSVLLFRATKASADAAKQSVVVAQQVFQTANRPYVGIEEINTKADPEKKVLQIVAAIKNFGTAPAEDFRPEWKVLLNNTQLSATGLPGAERILFPEGRVLLQAGFSDPRYQLIMSGTIILELAFRLAYKGQDGREYSYREKARYDPLIDKFISLGNQD